MQISNIDFIPDGSRILTGEHSSNRRFILSRLAEMAEEEGFREIVFPSMEMAGDRMAIRMEGASACRPLAKSIFCTRTDLRLWYAVPCISNRYVNPMELTMFGIEVLRPSEDPRDELLKLACDMVCQFTLEYRIFKDTVPAFEYYLDGIEIRSPRGDQLVVGGRYSEGYCMGFFVDSIADNKDDNYGH